MDCIAVASSGIENVVASCGTSLTEGQIRLLGRYTRRVVVNYDPDSAGMAATERSLALLLEAGFEAKVLALPGGLDPDEFIRKRGATAYGELLDSRAFLPRLSDGARGQTSTTCARRKAKWPPSTPSFPIWLKVPNPMLRAELAGRLAERLRVDERLLRDELRRAAGEGRREVKSADARSGLQATPAVKQLLRALPGKRRDGGCIAAGNHRRVARRPDWRPMSMFHAFVGRSAAEEKLNLAESEGCSSTEERRLAYEALLLAGGTAQPWNRRKVTCGRCGRRRLERERRSDTDGKSRLPSRIKDAARLGEIAGRQG